MAFYAEVLDGTVDRVVVAPSITWVQSRLSTDGTWVKTTNDLASDQYPGPGWTYDAAAKTFTAPYVEPGPEIPEEPET